MPEEQSIPSRIITSVNIPEPVISEGSGFTYNRFEPNERESRLSPEFGSIQSFESLPEVEAQARFVSRFTEPARYVRIDWGIVDEENISSNLENATLASSFFSNPILNSELQKINPGQILAEGTLSNFYFTAGEIIDTNSDSKIYSFLSSSVIFSEKLDTETANNSSMQDNISNYADRSKAAIDKELVTNILSDLTKQGYDSLLSEKAINDAKFINSRVKNQTFSISFNNIFIDDIIRASLDDKCSVFQDEIGAYAQYSNEIQERTVANIEPGSLTESDFESVLAAGSLFDYASSEQLSGELDDGNPHFGVYLENINPSINHIGYVIEKTEIIGSDQNFMEPIIIGKNRNRFIDNDVAYGATYLYKIRTLVALEYNFINSVSEDSGASQAFRGVFLVASRPNQFQVNCVEKIPPNPPSSINFKFDHRRKSLIMSWEFPKNLQGDVKGFQIFRRSSVLEPFTLISEYDFDNSTIRTERLEKAPAQDIEVLKDKNGKFYVSTVFEDKDFNPRSRFIYAIGSVDAHGMSSNYSSQFEVSYDSNMSKIKVKTISGPNAPKAYPNIHLKQDVFQDCMRVSGKDRMSVYFDPECYDVYRETESNKVSLNLLATSDNNTATYKINLINVDLQKNAVVDISIQDISTFDSDVDVPDLEEGNFSFTLKNNG